MANLPPSITFALQFLQLLYSSKAITATISVFTTLAVPGGSSTLTSLVTSPISSISSTTEFSPIEIYFDPLKHLTVALLIL